MSSTTSIVSGGVVAPRSTGDVKLVPEDVKNESIKVIETSTTAVDDKKYELIARATGQSPMYVERLLTLPTPKTVKLDQIPEIALHDVLSWKNCVGITDSHSVLNGNTAAGDTAGKTGYFATYSTGDTTVLYAADRKEYFAVKGKMVKIYGIRVSSRPPEDVQPGPRNRGYRQLTDDLWGRLTEGTRVGAAGFVGDHMFESEAHMKAVLEGILGVVSILDSPPVLTVDSYYTRDTAASTPEDPLEPIVRATSMNGYFPHDLGNVLAALGMSLVGAHEYEQNQTQRVSSFDVYELFIALGLKHSFEELVLSRDGQKTLARLTSEIENRQRYAAERRRSAGGRLLAAAREVERRRAFISKFGRERYDKAMKYDQTRAVFSPLVLSKYKYEAVTDVISKKEAELLELSMKNILGHKTSEVFDPRTAAWIAEENVPMLRKIAAKRFVDGWLVTPDNRKLICTHKLFLYDMRGKKKDERKKDEGKGHGMSVPDEFVKKFGYGGGSEVYCRICGEHVFNRGEDQMVSFVQGNMMTNVNVIDEIRDRIRSRAFPICGFLESKQPMSDIFRLKLVDYVTSYVYNFVAAISRQLKKDKSLTAEEVKRQVDLYTYVYLWAMMIHIADVNRDVRLASDTVDRHGHAPSMTPDEIAERIHSISSGRVRPSEVVTMLKTAVFNIKKAYDKVILDATEMKEVTRRVTPEMREIMSRPAVTYDNVPRASLSFPGENPRIFRYDVVARNVATGQQVVGYFKVRCPEPRGKKEDRKKEDHKKEEGHDAPRFGFHDNRLTGAPCSRCGMSAEIQDGSDEKGAQRFIARYEKTYASKDETRTATFVELDDTEDKGPVIDEEGVKRASDMLTSICEPVMRMQKNHLVNLVYFIGNTNGIYHSDIINGNARGMLNETGSNDASTANKNDARARARVSNLKTYITTVVRLYNVVRNRPEKHPLTEELSKEGKNDVPQPMECPRFRQTEDYAGYANELYVTFVGFVVKSYRNIKNRTDADKFLSFVMKAVFRVDEFKCMPVPTKLAKESIADELFEADTGRRAKKETDFNFSKMDYDGHNEEGANFE